MKNDGSSFKLQIEEMIKPYGALLIDFDYSYKYFGNMIVWVLDCDCVKHEFILDRGVVYVDNKTFANPKFSKKKQGENFCFLCQCILDTIKTRNNKSITKP